MNDKVFEQVEEAASFLRGRIAQANQPLPRLALVLGSGLGGFADHVEHPLAIPYSEIPNFPRSTVPGHHGRLLIGSVRNIWIAVMQGRVHAYEGYSADAIAFPTRVLGRLGARRIILTNAAGSLRPDLDPGSLVAIRDHINLSGANPCIGPNDDRLGPRFFDMSAAYSRRLRRLAQNTAAEQGWTMPEGVYVSVPGPSFETPAEIRSFRALGADLVGMSTVLEVIAARHMDLEVLAVSCVTNLAAGIGENELSHAEVMETGERVAERMAQLLLALIPKIAASGKEQDCI